MPDYPIANIFKIQIMFVDNLLESLIVFKHIQRLCLNIFREFNKNKRTSYIKQIASRKMRKENVFNENI